MKTRLSAMAAAISCLSMLTACGGSGPGTVDAASVPSAPAPTVTVTAPATATAGVAFDVAWTSTDAISCAADFDANTATSNTSHVTEPVAGTAAITKTYSVTCTGSGGRATGNVSVVISPNATAQGAWQGTTGSGRSIAGIVTNNDNYWLAYTTTDKSKPAGFYSGVGSSSSGNYSSQSLRAFDFEGVGVEQGTMTATYTQSVGYTSANTFAGSFDPPSGVSYDLSMDAVSVPMLYSAIPGGIPITMHYTGTWDSTTGQATVAGTLYIGIFDVTLNITGQTLLMDAATGTGVLNELVAPGTCDDSGAGFCGPFAPIFQGNMFNDTPGVTASTTTGTPFTPPSVSGTHTWSVWLAGANDGNGQEFPVPVTLTSLASIPSITADTFTTTYDSNYEETPSLDIVGGSYTAGSTGIDTTMYTDASLTIAADGSITGTEATSHCDYAGTIAPHGMPGNFYDVTLTFTGTNGSGGGAGGCVYDSQAFQGIATVVVDTSATPNTTKLTIMVVNAGRTKGFIVAATK